MTGACKQERQVLPQRILVPNVTGRWRTTCGQPWTTSSSPRA